jgi:hypothetical protein
MSLKNLKPLSATVTIRGEKIKVGGITNDGIFGLYVRFPIIPKWLSGNATMEDIMTSAPDALAAIIACACGFPGDEEAESVASKLTLDESAALLEKIIPFTMPDGLGPFVLRVNAIGLALAGPQALSAGKSNPAGTSQGASKRSLPSGIERKTSGK